MKTLLFTLLIGTLCFGQRIEIKNESFEFEKVVYFVQEDAKLPKNDRGITCYKVVNDKAEQFYFITDRLYNVKRFYSYKENRWYDFEKLQK